MSFEIRNARHAFRAAGENDTRTTKDDLFCRQNDRAQARTARLINCECWHTLRRAGAIRNLSRDIWTTARLPRTAPDRVLNLIGRHAGAAQTLLCYHHAEIGRGPRRERAAKTANRRAHRADEIDVFHRVGKFLAIN